MTRYTGRPLNAEAAGEHILLMSYVYAIMTLIVHTPF